ncbi:MAG: hypothetical protein VYB44_11855 [Bacteroidota bacterium]|nr:hypothetical protein [Bacteroidota bacterium]
MKKLLTVCFAALAAFMLACNVQYFEDAEFGDIVFDPSIAVVFGELNYTVSDLFEELNDATAGVTTNAENVVTIVYSEQLQSQSAEEFLQVQDQTFGSSLPAGTSISNPPATTTITISETYEFDLSQRGNEAYDSIFFKGGLFEFTVESDFNANIDFEATFQSLESNGTPLVMSGRLTASNNTFTDTESLANYAGYFHRDKDGNTTSNKFLVNLTYDIEVTPSSSIAAADRIEFNVGMTNTSFERVYGFIDSQELEVSFEIVSFDFFDQFGDGTIQFADPRVSFVFDNSFGFPLGVDFQQIAAITKTGQIINLSGDVINQLNVVARPTLANEGATRTTQIDLTPENSNIDELLNARPKRVIVDVQAASNPNGIPFQYNFVNDQSVLNVGVDIEIPLHLSLDELRAEESMPFTSPEDIDKAKRLLLRLIADNELPMGGLVEIQFLNDQGGIVYTIDEQPVFEAAPLGTNGRTTSSVRTIADIEMESEDIQAIKEATRINLVVKLSTTEVGQGANVKFFDDYQLKFTIAGQLDVELNTNGN